MRFKHPPGALFDDGEEDGHGEMAHDERLIGDAMAGDRQLFARQYAAELAWKIVEPISDDTSVLPPYKPGT
ncbi:hypothetical protein [Salinicola tamaricis]|uniref:hypothetical protein n=1 Tax=Salinicola tamaricis TaxID=1771309 RepID=UPI001A91D02D|nr:hypothetical protein [Salinicola tamaricis]